MRVGDGCTLVAYSRMVGFCLQAAELLAADGIECEVVDLRTLRPMDIGTVIESIKKSGNTHGSHCTFCKSYDAEPLRTSLWA